jgi:hypothetical protein
MEPIVGGNMNRPTQPAMPFQLTKKRVVELNQLGLKVYEYMNELGIKKEEYCMFGSIMQTLLSLPD